MFRNTGRFAVGETVVFTGSSPEQVRWGSNTDPTGILTIGHRYTVLREEVHSCHTKLELVGVAGKFNSVCFEPTEV